MKMSAQDHTQFATVAAHYHHMSALPEAEVLNITIGRQLEAYGLKGKRILDLACGTGRWSRFAASLGASCIIAVDISSAMIEAAKILTPSHDGSGTIKYLTEDCSRTLQGPDFEARFDVIMAVCFLNYAKTETEMKAMWDVIATNLASTGRVIALIPNLDLHDDYSIPIDSRYGTSFSLVRAVNEGQPDWGFQTRFTAHTGETSVNFEMYRLNREVYERTALAAGITDIQFLPMQRPRGIQPSEFWDEYMRRPHYELLLARK